MTTSIRTSIGPSSGARSPQVAHQFCLPLAASFATLKASDDALRSAIIAFESGRGTVAALAAAVNAALSVAEAARTIAEVVNAR